MPVTISSAQRRARLADRHRLLPHRATDGVPALAESVLALHSTDPVTVYLSAAARMVNPSIEGVERALYVDRSVVRHHAMRRTLWITTPPTLARMHATTTAVYAAAQHRRLLGMLADSGIADGEHWLAGAKADLLDLLHTHGPMTARSLGQRVPELAHPLRLAVGKPYEGTQAAHTRVLLQLGFEGAIVRTRPVGSWVSGQYTWAAMDTWSPGALLGPDGTPPDPRQAARDLARQWLRRFGPGTTTDVQWYFGWTATVTRRALADAGAVEVDLDGAPGWLDAADDLLDATGSAPETTAPGEPWVAVLPSLDPTTMGWKQRDWYLPAAAAEAFDRNGNAGATLWVDGRVVGCWTQASDGELRTGWFEAVPARRRTQLQRRLDVVRELLGDVRITVRFASPAQRELAGAR
ncbi:MAG: AlkZ family DNA glycosylase [Kineosporiaceae bacterium]|nr:AlkZ family DNA glycosylase [Kineosporiaceae bacterium]